MIFPYLSRSIVLSVSIIVGVPLAAVAVVAVVLAAPVPVFAFAVAAVCACAAAFAFAVFCALAASSGFVVFVSLFVVSTPALPIEFNAPILLGSAVPVITLTELELITVWLYSDFDTTAELAIFIKYLLVFRLFQAILCPFLYILYIGNFFNLSSVFV
jgi:hypothetical protein